MAWHKACSVLVYRRDSGILCGTHRRADLRSRETPMNALQEMGAAGSHPRWRGVTRISLPRSSQARRNRSLDSFRGTRLTHCVATRIEKRSKQLISKPAGTKWRCRQTMKRDRANAGGSHPITVTPFQQKNLTICESYDIKMWRPCCLVLLYG